MAPTLIAARALQGAGAALLVPSSLTLLNAACADDPARRARAVGLWTAVGGVSIAAGPIIGGALLEAFGWQSIFLVNVPVCIAAAWLALRGLVSPAAKARHFDPAGQLLALMALTALVASIIEASAPATSHALIGAGFVVALLAAAAFCLVEAHVAAPMLPLDFFRLPAFTSAVLFGVAVNLTYYGIVFVLSFYLQQARSYSTFEAGLAYVPLTATFIVSNVASAAVSARHGPRLSMAAGALVGAAGFTLLARLDASSPYLAMLPAFILIPLGMGLAVPAMTTVVLASVGMRFTGTASGALNAARQIGGAIGVALFGALLGRGSDSIIPALHAAAHVSTALLVIAATMAWIGVRRGAAGLTVACRRAI